MITYEEALKIAKDNTDNIDRCTEYDIAYSFVSDEDMHKIGGSSPIIILKETGEILYPSYFYNEYKAEEIRTFDIDE
ncbi:MAG: hypothetical protein Q4B60_04310 [Erysipelotrichaceae bacterium]|nr:hypothetical protein [Erysipelotrichaceae bacterium]